MHHKFATVGVALLIVAAAVVSLMYIGTEFMPRLDEGSILITTRKMPGISLTDSIEVSNRIERIVKSFPEIRGVVSKLGRPDVATEAMGIYEADVYVLLHPYSQWKRFSGKQQLIDALAQALEPIPGVSFNFTQPMAMRLDETVSGIKGDLAIKIFGEDSRTLEALAERTLRVLNGVPGAVDTQMEIVSGVAELSVIADRSALARYGLNVHDVSDLMQVAISGMTVSEYIENQRRFDIVLRLPGDSRKDLESIRDLRISAPGGESVRLGQVASVQATRGPEVISREDGQRRIVVQSNVRSRDLGSFVADVRQRMEKEVKLPPGYTIDYGGQFENQERATRRLMLVLPVTFLIIFAILFATFDSVPQALLILCSVPFSVVGGVGALWARDLNLNLSGSVGFIALFGVAVLNGILVVTTMNQLRDKGAELSKAALQGAAMRLRPVIMTALVPSLGFIPAAITTSTGAEVQRPLATVVIGGLITSTLFTLFILPVIYPWFSKEPEAIELIDEEAI